MTPTVYLHTSESMPEVRSGSVRLLVGASVYLGKGATWADYADLYRRVYVDEGLRVLRPDGALVVIQTDAYEDGSVVPKNALLPLMLINSGFRLLDTKVWRRRAADFFQPPFSQVFVFAPPGGSFSRKRAHDLCGDPAYLQGVWDFPQGKGGELNSYPDALCSLLVRSFTEPGDLLLDPFAGTARLLRVAHDLGREAVGYELNPELRDTIAASLGPDGMVDATPLQVAPDEPRESDPAPSVEGCEWIVGDARDVIQALPEEDRFDFLFSCPPYGDLEVYSDDPADLSTMSPDEFLVAYRQIIASACARLRNDRFAVWVVGEFRDRSGAYRDFVGETVQAFRDAGLAYYNEAVLVTPLGSVPVRAGRFFTAARKLGKTHQNVLVFVKGDWRRAVAACGTVDVSDALSAVEGLDSVEDVEP